MPLTFLTFLPVRHFDFVNYDDLELQPGDARWHYLAGAILLDNGRLAEAAARFETALRVDPAHEGARRALQQIDPRRK